MKLLITGSNGLLGQKIVNQCLKRNIDFIATSIGNDRNSKCPTTHYETLDIRNYEDVLDCIQRHKPTHIIHTAAMTAVDQCEVSQKECHTLNVVSTENLWRVSKEMNIHLQLLSTDFIFDGEKGNYVEEDLPNPLSVYAKSKVDAENVLHNDENRNWSIIRTIIVYGSGVELSRGNIIYWAKGVLSRGQSISIIDDQFRAPTWADDLAWACIRVCELNKQGVYHICGPETMSIYEIVFRIAKFFNYDTSLIQKTDSSTLNQPAKRPPKTGFDISKARRELGYDPKTLEETLSIL